MESSINKESIVNSFIELSNILDLVKEDKDFLNEIGKIVSTIVESLKKGNKILFMGNGGSAGDSQHMAAEFICRFIKDRDSIPGLALTTDTSVLTAISNDYGYEKIFSRQIEGLGKKFDTIVAFSTSGNSKNIILGLQKARKLGLNTIGLTGQSGGEMSKYCDHILKVPSLETPRIQELHILIGHIICEATEKTFLNKKNG